MGHVVGYFSEKEKCDRKRVLADIVEMAERDGDGYPGAVKWHDEVAPLENRDAAEKFIQAHDRGWYDDHAVRYYDFSNTKETKTISEAREKINETTAKAAEYAKAHSVKNQKAAFIGCAKCGSKISKEYLRGESCPVCRNDLRSKTVLDTLVKYNAKVNALLEKIKKEKEKQTGEVRWLIKYEYHC